MKKVSKCPHCGAPIYAKAPVGDAVPEIAYTCACRIALTSVYHIPWYREYPQSPQPWTSPTVPQVSTETTFNGDAPAWVQT